MQRRAAGLVPSPLFAICFGNDEPSRVSEVRGSVQGVTGQCVCRDPCGSGYRRADRRQDRHRGRAVGWGRRNHSGRRGGRPGRIRVRQVPEVGVRQRLCSFTCPPTNDGEPPRTAQRLRRDATRWRINSVRGDRPSHSPPRRLLAHSSRAGGTTTDCFENADVCCLGERGRSGNR